MAGFPLDPPVGRVIDFGGHYFSDDVPFRSSHYETYEEYVPHFADPDEFARLFEAANIDGTIAVAPPYAQKEAAQAKIANDALLEAVASHEVFLGGLAAIPMVADGESAAAEFERCLDNGFNGGVLHAASADGRPLTDDRFDPVWEVADQTGAPIMVHPKRMNVLEDHNNNDIIFGHELSLCDSIATVIHTGLLDRYPNLHFVYDHFGGNIASMLGRIRYRTRPDRWPGDFEGKHWTEFEAQLAERIYIKMSGFSAHHIPIQATLEAVPASHILFGTDFPFEPRTVEELNRYVEHVKELASVPDRRRIFGGNTAELLVNF